MLNHWPCVSSRWCSGLGQMRRRVQAVGWLGEGRLDDAVQEAIYNLCRRRGGLGWVGRSVVRTRPARRGTACGADRGFISAIYPQTPQLQQPAPRGPLVPPPSPLRSPSPRGQSRADDRPKPRFQATRESGLWPTAVNTLRFQGQGSDARWPGRRLLGLPTQVKASPHAPAPPPYQQFRRARGGSRVISPRPPSTPPRPLRAWACRRGAAAHVTCGFVEWRRVVDWTTVETGPCAVTKRRISRFRGGVSA